MSQRNAFMDRAACRVVAGRGGDGASHFRREKFVPLGGPDGGDGGHGGSVIFEARENLKTLVDFAYRREYKATPGAPGGGARKSGKGGQDCLVAVPVGTLVLTPQGVLVADLRENGQRAVVAKGGRGGRGNIHFATPLRRAPRLAEKGEPGEERDLVLELKLLADVGIVGLPNAGKSTLLAALTAAHPKIADYPFTTLTPNLGRVRIDEGENYALVDIPGLIEGAAQGIGLGHDFLRHIERTRLLIHLIDAGTPGSDPKKDFATLNRELKLYQTDLEKRPQLVALNKADLAGDPGLLESQAAEFRRKGYETFVISAAARQGVWELAKRAYARLQTLPLPKLKYKLPTHEPAPRFTVEKLGPETWRVSGQEVEKWMAMTDFDNLEAVARLRRIFERIGLNEEFHRLGLKDGDTVMVGKQEFYYQED